MGADGVCWTRKETTHSLGAGRYVVVRQTWQQLWLVEESDPFAGSRRLALVDTRAEADALASLAVATRLLRNDEVA